MCETEDDSGNSEAQLASLALDGQRRTNPRESEPKQRSLQMKPATPGLLPYIPLPVKLARVHHDHSATVKLYQHPL